MVATWHSHGPPTVTQGQYRPPPTARQRTVGELDGLAGKALADLNPVLADLDTAGDARRSGRDGADGDHLILLLLERSDYVVVTVSYIDFTHLGVA